MTGTEAALAARKYANAYKYIYGAKGELCSSAHIEDLIAQSPAYFSDAQKKAAARAKAGSYCADCSGFVCICSGYSQYGSYALFDIAEKKYPLVKENGKVIADGKFIPLGAILWKPGHVGIYVGNQVVIEARSELVDVETNPIGSRDFTYCLFLPGIEYTENPNDTAVVNVDSSYENKWTGKIVNAPSVVPQISPSNKQAAFGFGMLNNGTQVTVVGVDKDYYRIKSAFGSYGYVYSYYIGTLNAASYEKQYNQWVGSANSTTGIVNIRTGPSTTYDQNSNVPSVSNGGTFEVLGEVLGNSDNRLWYYVRILGQYYGYVRSDLVSRQIMVSYTAWIGEAKSSTGTVNIRTAPTVNSALSGVLSALSNGNTVTVTSETRGNDGMVWYAVSVGGRHAGYCRSDLITPHVKDYYVEWEGVIKTSTGSANLRTAASSSAAKVTGSPYANGTNVHVFGETTGADGYTWYHLSVENKYVGYCRCDLVITTTDYPNWWGKANTTTGTLNIRSGAGTEYSLISGCPNVKNGTQMKVTGQVCGNDGDVWYKVTVNGTYKGYVKGKLVIPVNTVAYSSWLGCARSTTGTVNVRSQASTASSIISGYPQLKNGDCFDVIGQVSGTDGYLWFYVRIMGLYYGYIRSDLVSHGVIKENNTGYASWAGIVKSTTGTVNIRSGAGTGASIVKALKNGDGVEVIGTTNGTDGYVWYQVKYGNVNGYVRSDLVIHMSNVIDPPDSPTEPVVKATIIPYKKNGVVICTTSLKEATNATAEAKRQMPIGTYVSITQLVVLADGSRWLNCTYDSITGYIEEQNINVFPNEEWCGGANYRDLSKHSFEHKDYGVFECRECGYHVDEKTYYYYMISNVFENIYDQFRFPEELRKQLNFSSSLGEISVTYPLTPYIDITVSESASFDTNSDGSFTFTFEDNKLKMDNVKIAWGDFYAKLSDWGISDTLDINQLAIAVGYGNIETKYTVSPTKIEIEFSISIPIGDKCSGNISIKYIFKNEGQLNQNELALYGELVKVPEMSTWSLAEQDGVSMLSSILTTSLIFALGIVGIAVFLPEGSLAILAALVVAV